MESLHKISLNNEIYYLFSNIPSTLGDIELTLTNGGESYNGKASSDEIINMANAIDMAEDKFYRLIRESFCGCGSSIVNKFIYQMNKDSDSSYKFVWKQVLEGGMKFQLGNIAMVKEDNPSMKILQMLGSLIKQLITLKAEVSSLQNSTESLESEKKIMCKRMEGYIKAKESLEQDLYTKFSLVLNEKKARIRELKKQVDSKASSSQKRSTTISKENNDKDANLTDTDENMDTDEEKERNTVKIKPALTSALDSSTDIILDDEIVVDEDKPKKNRKRIRSSKPKTPVGAVVPRTTSLPRPKRQPSGEGASSLKKMRSKEISEEALLDEM